MLLPHGFEGQGPEHSSARIERFLTLCAENNMQVANCTTPAQYFHLLRRQMYGGADRRGMRKPLIIFTPKSLLRHPRAVSTLHEFTSGGFMRDPGRCGRCRSGAQSRAWSSAPGKIYYDLLAAREERASRTTSRWCAWSSCIRSPPSQANDILTRYPPTAEVVWAQEEPRNMGPWRFMREQFQPLLDRDAAARSATSAGRKAPARPRARASGTSRSRRTLSTTP